VSLDEVIVGVAIALGQRPLTDCLVLDFDDDSVISIDELVGAVASAIFDCPD
jgi:hypothetical protein